MVDFVEDKPDKAIPANYTIRLITFIRKHNKFSNISPWKVTKAWKKCLFKHPPDPSDWCVVFLENTYYFLIISNHFFRHCTNFKAGGQFCENFLCTQLSSNLLLEKSKNPTYYWTLTNNQTNHVIIAHKLTNIKTRTTFVLSDANYMLG